MGWSLFLSPPLFPQDWCEWNREKKRLLVCAASGVQDTARDTAKETARETASNSWGDENAHEGGEQAWGEGLEEGVRSERASSERTSRERGASVAGLHVWNACVQALEQGWGHEGEGCHALGGGGQGAGGHVLEVVVTRWLSPLPQDMASVISRLS